MSTATATMVNRLIGDLTTDNTQPVPNSRLPDDLGEVSPRIRIRRTMPSESTRAVVGRTWQRIIANVDALEALRPSAQTPDRGIEIWSVFKAAMAEKDALSQLKRIASLEDDWDSYGSKRPPKNVISTARKLVQRISERVLVSDWKISPTPDQTVFLRYEHFGTRFCWEVFPDGGVVAVTGAGDGLVSKEFESGSIKVEDMVRDSHG